MSDFFDLPEENFSRGKVSKQAKKVDPNIYDPDPNAFNGSYKSVFRFVPYLHDKAKTSYTKYTAKFYNPLTKESLIVDCPSNVEKPSIIWTIDTVLRKAAKDEPEIADELKKIFSRWYTTHSPVYIKKDPQRPDLEDQVKIFKFRNQIGQLIDQQMNPEEVEGISVSRKINPYHLLEGKDFLCIVGKKTKDFRDWSKCKFMDEVSPLIFKIGDKAVQVKNDEKSVKLVSEFLIKNTPKMDEYFHEEWTEETYTKVADSIVSAIPYRKLIDEILQKSKDTKINDLVRERLGKPTTNKPSSAHDDLEFKSEKEPVSESPFKDSPAPVEESSDEYDDLFKNL